MIDILTNDIQLAMLPSLIRSTLPKVTKVTSIRTICDTMCQSETNKKTFNELHSLLRILVTVPATTATAERTFSAMKRLNTYLRNTITQKRMNQLLLSYVHKKFFDHNVDIEDVIKEFVSRNERLEQYFGRI